jgi:hypothetical protein
MFGDWAWVDKYSERQLDRLAGWLQGPQRLIVVELGAGNALPTVRRFSERHGPRVIRINPRENSIVPDIGVGIAGGAAEVLRVLDSRLMLATGH